MHNSNGTMYYDKNLAIKPIVLFAAHLIFISSFSFLFFVTNHVLRHKFNVDNLDLRIQIIYRVVSTIHAVLSATCSFMVLYFHKDVFDGSLYDDYSVRLTIAISVSYFIYDLFCMIFIKELRDYVYITHHIVGLFGLIASKREWVLIALCRLISEFSTPFINNLWFLSKLNLKESKLFFCNSCMILITFTVCRILPIIPLWNTVLYFVNMDEWNDRSSYNKFIIVYYLITCCFFDVMNVYWFTKIIRICLKKFKTKIV